MEIPLIELILMEITSHQIADGLNYQNKQEQREYIYQYQIADIAMKDEEIERDCAIVAMNIFDAIKSLGRVLKWQKR
jgi:hypothetical protein